MMMGKVSGLFLASLDSPLSPNLQTLKTVKNRILNLSKGRRHGPQTNRRLHHLQHLP